MITLCIIVILICVLILIIALAASVLSLLWAIAPILIVAYIAKRLIFGKSKKKNGNNKS